jgi:hypothetical protein
MPTDQHPFLVSRLCVQLAALIPVIQRYETMVDSPWVTISFSIDIYLQ